METRHKATVKLDTAKPTVQEHAALGSVGEPEPDARRRRLLGGALAATPAILTLRSGGIAAASCVGVGDAGTNRLNVPLGTGGLIPDPPSSSITAGSDVCIKGYEVCPDFPDHKIVKGVATGSAQITEDTVGNKTCVGFADGDLVAILSSTASASFIGP